MKKETAIVTGGTRGIGLAITKALREAGHPVAAICHGNEEAAQKCSRETGASVYKADVCDFEACQKMVMMAEDDLGPVGIVVNNAGITKDGVLHKMSLEDWENVLRTNLYSCFNLSRAVMQGMRDRSFGRIINITSINGQKGQFGQTNYCAAKAGMIGFTKALALEGAAKNITVNAVAPGYIETDMTAAMKPEVLQTIVKQIPTGRMGLAEEIASLVAYLSSKEAGFINGATIPVNGGQYMC